MLALFEHFSVKKKSVKHYSSILVAFSRKTFFFREHENKSNFSRKNIFQKKRRQTRSSSCEDWGKVSGVKLKNVMNLLKLLLYYVYYFGSDSTLLKRYNL